MRGPSTPISKHPSFDILSIFLALAWSLFTSSWNVCLGRLGAHLDILAFLKRVLRYLYYIFIVIFMCITIVPLDVTVAQPLSHRTAFPAEYASRGSVEIVPLEGRLATRRLLIAFRAFKEGDILLPGA